MIDFILNFFQDRTFGAVRNSGWSKASSDYIKRNPLCEMGLHKPTLLNVLNTHHILPFHKHPELEMDENNWIVLCRFHHFLHAHLGNWSSFNAEIKKEAKDLCLKIKTRP